MLRKYNSRDVDMLIAALTLIDNCREHLEEIEYIRPKWDSQFFDKWYNRIKGSMQNYVGADVRMPLKESTMHLLDKQQAALRDLALFRAQLNVDYKHDPNRHKLLDDMFGFPRYLAAARNGDQESLIALLFRVRNNMDTKMMDELKERGMRHIFLQNLKDHANNFTVLELKQEVQKTQTREHSATAVTELNAIYDFAIGVSQVTSSIFLQKPEVHNKFVFSQIVGRLSTRPSTASEQPEPDQQQEEDDSRGESHSPGQDSSPGTPPINDTPLTDD